MVSLTTGMQAVSLRKSEVAFPVELRPLFTVEDGKPREVEGRRAVVRTDTGAAVEVVSDRYTLVPHDTIIERVEAALERLGLGAVPRGVHLFKGGAVMKALYKIEPRRFDIGGGDMLCPVIRVGNSYDASQRVNMELGAFRFACTNLAIGGGGMFAGGFCSIHAGKIDVGATADQMGATLEAFGTLAETFRNWRARTFKGPVMGRVLASLSDSLAPKHRNALLESLDRGTVATVWDAYNEGTFYATHKTKTASTAYRVLTAVNRAFDAGTNEN